jgi:hypothetical protein
MQGGEDHFQRRAVLEFRVPVNRDAPPIVAHGEEVARLKRELDGAGVPGHGLVHGVVQDLGGEMMQRGLVRAADIHAGTPAYRLEPFQHLDVAGGVAVRRRVAGGLLFPGLVFLRLVVRAPASRPTVRGCAREKVVHVVFLLVPLEPVNGTDRGTGSGRQAGGQGWGARLVGAALPKPTAMNPMGSP